MKKLLVLAELTKKDMEKITEAVSGRLEVVDAGESADTAQKRKAISEASIIIGEPDIADIRDSKTLEWVQMTWAGTDKYTCHEGFPKQAVLTNMRGAFGVVMSEYAVGAILSLYRRFPAYYKQQEKGSWMDAGCEESLCGKTVLLLGTGDIGTSLAVRLKAFGTKNIGVRRKKDYVLEAFDEMYDFAALDMILPQADIIACSLPDKPLTRGLLDERRLRLMKRDALLLNMGRGSLIVTQDLVRVLSEGWLRGVVLDVTNPEPLPKEHPLWNMENVLITPHIAGPSLGHSPVTQERIVDICCENLKRYLAGRALINVIAAEEFEIR